MKPHNQTAMAANISKPQKHITEIDSLRALAVLFVVLYHAFPAALPGGFIGVDMFFVISGFVISRAYLFDLLEGRRTLREFYLARFRRLAPALGVVLALTTVAALLVLQPDQLIAYGWSLAAQVIYASNFVFWYEGDYFRVALTKLLLHTWSLAVEEQFYVLWAALILFLRRFPRTIWVVLALGVVLSLAIGILAEPRSPKTVFFMLPTRIWEFFLGIAAYMLARRAGEIDSAGVSRLGLLVMPVLIIGMVASAVFFAEGATFPGSQAALAGLTTAVALTLLDRLSGHHALAWLRLPPLTYIGRVSYGFYLWHWPPLVIFSMVSGAAAPPLVATAMMALAFLGSAVSYHVVEDPIRRRQKLPQPRAILRFVAASSAITLGLGFLFIFSNGLIARYPADIRPYLTAPDQHGIFRCGKIYALMNPALQTCPLSVGPSTAAILILGDSHADVLKEMITEVGTETGKSVHLTTRNCDLGRFGSDPFCSRAVFNQLLTEAQLLGVTEVVAVSLWDEGKFDTDTMAVDISAILNAGMNVALFKQVPGDDSYDPVARARAALDGMALDRTGITRTAHLVAHHNIDQILDVAASRFPADRVRVFEPADILCPNATCLYEQRGMPLYMDATHLTLTGANVLRPMFVRLLSSSQD